MRKPKTYPFLFVHLEDPDWNYVVMASTEEKANRKLARWLNIGNGQLDNFLLREVEIIK